MGGSGSKPLPQSNTSPAVRRLLRKADDGSQEETSEAKLESAAGGLAVGPTLFNSTSLGFLGQKGFKGLVRDLGILIP